MNVICEITSFGFSKITETRIRQAPTWSWNAPWKLFLRLCRPRMSTKTLTRRALRVSHVNKGSSMLGLSWQLCWLLMQWLLTIKETITRPHEEEEKELAFINCVHMGKYAPSYSLFSKSVLHFLLFGIWQTLGFLYENNILSVKIEYLCRFCI